METNNNSEDVSLFTKIAPELKNRMSLYITTAKLVGDEKADSQKKLVEEAIHEYLVNNPHSIP